MTVTTTHMLRASLKPRLYTGIEIESGASLYALAEAITNAFKCDFDHAFGFFSLWGGKTSDVLRRLVRKRGVVRSTPDAIAQCPRSDALSAEGSAFRASGCGRSPGCSTARTRSARIASAVHPAL